jgi:mercuric ion transport protein
MLVSDLIPSFGVVSSLGAIASKTCCVLPLAMAGAGAGVGSVALVQALAPLQMPLLALSAILVGAGWVSYLLRVKSEATCECTPDSLRRTRRSVAVLTIATILLGTAIAWDVIQPSVIQMAS